MPLSIEAISEPIILLLFFVCFVLCVTIAKKLGSAALNVVFISFAVGIFLLAASRLFLDLGGWGVYQFSETSLHIWWHVLFYLSMVSFIWGGRRIKEISLSDTPVGFSSRDKNTLGTVMVVGIAIFLVAPLTESYIGPILEGSIIDTLGIHHLIAMVLGMITSYYLFLMKKSWGKLLTVGVTPMVVFLVCMGVQHLWELLTESWKVLIVAGELIEQVEQVILVVGLFFFMAALWRVRKIILNPSPV